MKYNNIEMKAAAVAWLFEFIAHYYSKYLSSMKLNRPRASKKEEEDSEVLV